MPEKPDRQVIHKEMCKPENQVNVKNDGVKVQSQIPGQTS